MEKAQKVKFYTDEEKRKIIEEYLTSGKSIKEIHAKYNIRGHSKIQEWMIKFGLRKKFEKQLNESKAMNHLPNKSIKEVENESRIKELEEQLAESKMQSLLLNTMIDLAEEQLKVSIRKKSGAKQLKK